MDTGEATVDLLTDNPNTTRADLVYRGNPCDFFLVGGRG